MGSVPEIKNLESLLEKHFQTKIKILDQTSKLLTAPGENYGSIMVALDVKIEDENNKRQELNLVAKLIPVNEILKEMFQVQITFIKEYRVYTKIVPTLKAIEDEYGILEERASDLFAKNFGGRSNLHEEEGTVDNDSVLLLENLKIRGFETGDRLKGFNYETAVFILKKLAKVHATSIAIKYQKPDVYKEVVLKTLCVPMTAEGLNKDKCMQFVDGIADIVRKEGYEKQLEKVKKNLTTKFTTSFYSTADPKDPFVTFCHSDFWINNMMVKLDENKTPQELIIVDFQTPQCQTVVADLLFFIYSSVSPSILYDKVDELLKIYYDSFIDRLKAFQVSLNKFSWDDFMQEIKVKASDFISQILMMYKPILLERGQIKDMNTFEEDDLMSLENVSEHCKTCMKKTFVQFADKGWI